MSQNEIFTVYLDMDGVICDMKKQYYNISHENLDDDYNEDNKKVWNRIESFGKEKFFAEMPWTIGGKLLWNYIINNFLKVKILSSSGKACEITKRGKLKWLAKNISSLSNSDIIIVDNKRFKKDYASPSSILIDDTPSNIKEWNDTGGIGILYKNTSDTIDQLIKYVYK